MNYCFILQFEMFHVSFKNFAIKLVIYHPFKMGSKFIFYLLHLDLFVSYINILSIFKLTKSKYEKHSVNEMQLKKRIFQSLHFFSISNYAQLIISRTIKMYKVYIFTTHWFQII